MIERDEYLNIISKMPFICVDLVIVHQGKYLLVKRKNPPAQNLWWFVGGRLLKGEKLTEAVVRKAEEEVGLKVTPRRMINVVETIFPDGPEGIPVHTVNVCFLCISHDAEVKLDGDHHKYKWVSTTSIPPDLDHRLKETLELIFEQ